MRKIFSFVKLWLFTTAGYALHGLLDACTTYGTQLYFPFSPERVSWNTVSIVDPLVTLLLVSGCVITMCRETRRGAKLTLLFMLAYLGFGYAQNQRAETAMFAQAALRGTSVERFKVMPTLGNSLLWRSLYRSQGRLYVDGIYVGVMGDVRFYRGGVLSVVNPEAVFPKLGKDSRQRRDIKRFDFFAQHFMALHPSLPHTLIDARYSTLPTGTLPFWGLEVSPKTPDRHATFAHLLTVRATDWNTFFIMLQGKPLP